MSKVMVTFKIQGAAPVHVSRYVPKLTPATRRSLLAAIRREYKTSLVKIVSALELFKANINGREVWVTVPE